VPPVKIQHHEGDREIQPDRRSDQAGDSQTQSEERDRSFVRQSLGRGMAVQQMEDHLLAASEFHRLNPEGDTIAYLRNLINEEESSLRSFDLARVGVGHRSQFGPGVHHSQENQYAIRSEAVSRRYIQENFESGDWLAVVVRNQATDQTVQRIATAQNIAGPEFQSWLRCKNANGFEIYLSLNTLKEHARGRTKGDFQKLRHLYLDLDEGGRHKLAAIYQSPAIPPPNYVLETSPHKYQVIWRVEGITQIRAEELLRGMAQRFGGDPAATDAARVFRLPGFNNKKYSQDFTVRLKSPSLPDVVYRELDFKIETIPRELGLTARGGRSESRGLHSGSARTQSERDWAYAVRHLREGSAPQKIVQELASFRATDRPGPRDSKPVARRKPNPLYYAERTVGRAMEYLGMTSDAPRQSSDRGDDNSPETEPSR
jgi:hypothetical protein